jgi:hypothetical protein
MIMRALPGISACSESTRPHGGRAAVAAYQHGPIGQDRQGARPRIGAERHLPVEHDLVGHLQHIRAPVRREASPAATSRPEIDKSVHRPFAIALGHRGHERVANVGELIVGLPLARIAERREETGSIRVSVRTRIGFASANCSANTPPYE